ncbi:MAG: ribosome assembly RNA-binding protein YhbY [Proteobacteria bacterium]|nr:MAG: ribosome assembly RNA-binding protein YhbY [Pseudomonadota bacterium]
MKLVLNSKQISFLRGRAHKLDPVVTVGNNGVSEGVIKELEFTLKTFELIKIKLRCDDQDELLELVANITESVKATKIQIIGHTLVLYRRSKEPKIPVPGLPLPEAQLKEELAPIERKRLTFKKPLNKKKTYKRTFKVASSETEGKKAFPKVYKKSAPKREKPATGRGFSRGSR